MSEVEAPKRWVAMSSLPRKEQYVCIRTLTRSGTGKKVDEKIYFQLQSKQLGEVLGVKGQCFEITVVLDQERSGESAMDYIEKNCPMPEEQSRKLFLQLTLLVDYLHETGYTHNPFFLLESALLDPDFNLKAVYIEKSLFGKPCNIPHIGTIMTRNHKIIRNVLYYMLSGVFLPYIKALEKSDIEHQHISPVCKHLLIDLIFEEKNSTGEILEHDWMKHAFQEA